LVIAGTAFLPTSNKSKELPTVRVVPTRLIDQALSGGGGNPNIAPSDAQQKGNTLVPPPVEPTPAPTRVESPPPRPAPPAPRVEVKKPEPKRPEARKPDPLPLAKPNPVKPNLATKPAPTKPAPLDLKPVVRNPPDKQRAKAEAEAREREAATQAATRQLAKQMGRTIAALTAGFEQGTKVEVSGSGGEAYESYVAFVRSAYDDAWVVSQDLANDDSVALVKIVIARNGQVLRAEISQRSGNTALDRSVQRALDKVKSLPPFPEAAREEQRTFTIEFNLKAKRLSG
jgi:TonB family protein